MMVFLNGQAIAEPDARGQRIVDSSFLVLINASAEDIDFTLPTQGYAPAWEVALDTAPEVDGDSDPVLGAGETVTVEARSMLFLTSAPHSPHTASASTPASATTPAAAGKGAAGAARDLAGPGAARG